MLKNVTSAKGTHELAGQGEAEIAQTIQMMNEIREVVNALATSIAELGQQSMRLVGGSHHDIADQTNLLALNAAIEAVAGEQGALWVVADKASAG